MEVWAGVISGLVAAVFGKPVLDVVWRWMGLRSQERKDDVTYIHDGYREAIERNLADLKELKALYAQAVADNMRLNARIVQLELSRAREMAGADGDEQTGGAA